MRVRQFVFHELSQGDLTDESTNSNGVRAFLACPTRLWMHPFRDGNGRVARLMSHATLLGLLDTGAFWSVARGLARNVQQYKTLLANCDSTRRNDLDGRGALSEEALAEFTRFFLTVCIDQVDFMESLVQPDRLRARVLVWAEEEVRAGELPNQSARLLEAVLHRGELPRGEVDAIAGRGERQDAGFWLRWLRRACWRRKARARRCTWRFPRTWPAVDAGAVPRAAEYMSEGDTVTHGDRDDGLTRSSQRC